MCVFSWEVKGLRQKSERGQVSEESIIAQRMMSIVYFQVLFAYFLISDEFLLNLCYSFIFNFYLTRQD